MKRITDTVMEIIDCPIAFIKNKKILNPLIKLTVIEKIGIGANGNTYGVHVTQANEIMVYMLGEDFQWYFIGMESITVNAQELTQDDMPFPY